MSIPEFHAALDACKAEPDLALAIARNAVRAIRESEPDPQSFIHVPNEPAAVQPGPLLGCVYSVKDNIDVLGLPTTCGSRLFEQQIATSDAAVVEDLRAAGALCIGKNNMHELALGATGVNLRFGTATNPWDSRRIAGGSSGGSAVAVSLRQVHMALGTDSGGSVRIPAAMCGVVGFKPTGGAISLDGVQGAAWSIDHVGIMAPRVDVVTAVWDTLHPPTSSERYGGPRLAYLADDSMGRVSPNVWATYMSAIERLERSGFDLVGISLPNLTAAPYICVSVVYPEIASQHHDLVRASPDLYSDDIRALVYLGELWSGRNYLDAQRLRMTMQADYRKRTDRFDAILTPTVAVQPPLFNEPAHVPGDAPDSALYTAMRFTVPFNAIGYPAISVPAGTDPEGLPFGLQVVGKPNQDRQLLQIAQKVEDELGPMPSPASQDRQMQNFQTHSQ